MCRVHSWLVRVCVCGLCSGCAKCPGNARLVCAQLVNHQYLSHTDTSFVRCCCAFDARRRAFRMKFRVLDGLFAMQTNSMCLPLLLSFQAPKLLVVSAVVPFLCIYCFAGCPHSQVCCTVSTVRLGLLRHLLCLCGHAFYLKCTCHFFETLFLSFVRVLRVVCVYTGGL